MRCHLCTEGITRDQERCPGGTKQNRNPARFYSIYNHKVGRKREIPDKNHPTTRKQNLACLTYDQSYAINKTISELLRNGNDIENMHFRVASFECRQNNSQENTKFRFSGVMHDINKTQPLALHLFSIYRINY